MAWRKWFVRSLVFSVLGLAVLAALLYEAWTNPAAVRRQVHDKLHKLFIGATISVDSARLRLLGGIGVRRGELLGTAPQLFDARLQRSHAGRLYPWPTPLRG
jgi:hypothetical protein